MRDPFNKLLLLITCLFLPLGMLSCSSNHGNETAESPAQKMTDAHIDSLIGKMTLQEKIGMIHGNGFFTSAGVKSLGIPEFHYTDGPFGIREELHNDSWTPLGLTTDSATYMPTGSALAATWDTTLAHAYGVTLGQEARERGKDMLLGPAVNIERIPNGGRTFEFLTEDPFLNSELTVAYIEGVQSQDVASCVKHYVANNQETNRGTVNVKVSQRALHEIYMPAFKAAVEQAHVDGVMAAYNKVNGNYCSENPYLLTDVLRNDWGFKGMVISDWGGVHTTVSAAKAGLDVEMGSGSDFNKYYFADPLMDSVKAGLVSESVINEKVHHILQVMYNLKMMGNGQRAKGSINTPEHHSTAYDVASESIVLLKNANQLLPLDDSQIKTLAVIGDNATKKQAQLGFGAGVKAQFEITPLEGLENKLKGKVSIRFAQGYKEEYKNEKGQGGKIPVDTPNKKLIDEAVRVAKSSDAAIIFAGNTRTYETEGSDRASIALPFGENALIKAVTAANPKTVVVIISGAPVNLDQAVKESNAMLWSGYNGSEGGHAMADVLFGDVNPSGKLPFTFPKSLKDTPAESLGTFPGKNDVADYKEGILVGYRWYDTKKIAPLFPFGYGLSYTTFEFSDVRSDMNTYEKDGTITVSVNLKNTGVYPGKETVQLYVHAVNAKVMMPEKELKAFKKVELQPDQESVIQLPVKVKDLAYYDEGQKKWVVPDGKYEIEVGSSSRDIRGTTTITVR